MPEIVPLRLDPSGFIELIDQTLLPLEERCIEVHDVAALCEAIRSLRVRGAPLLGLAGAAGVALAARTGPADDLSLREAGASIIATRPTAVDLAVRVREALTLAGAQPLDAELRRAALWQSASQLLHARQLEDRQLAALGASLLPADCAVLTHCNTGALATGGIGTALGVIRAGWEAGRLRECYATETRPLLQGARLTMWELARLGIPATLLPDTAAAALIASGRVQAVITGADRIAANGDSANKIGTYGLALAAARHGVPFYIAAPTSTIDQSCPAGEAIPIEFRDGQEVGGFGATRWSPAGTRAYNPAFDVTPADLITAIVTEQGIAQSPFGTSIAGLLAHP